MKLCPQCDFIYEDDQRFCDMDGKELIHDPAPVVKEQSFASAVKPPASPSPNLMPVVKPAPLAGRRWRGLAVAAIVGVVLTALVIVVYVARTHQRRSRTASQSSIQSPERSIDRSTEQYPAQSPSADTSSQPAASNLVSGQTSPADTALREQSREKSPEQSASSPADVAAPGSSPAPSQPTPSRASPARPRLTASLVSAGAPSGNSRAPVIVRLNNGASIRADEAWERKEGIWYRQAGMVTFLRRSRVRTIGRLASPTAPSKSATNNVPEKSQKPEDVAARNQFRLARLEPADPKKQSRLTSFLKKTGRILKKPFKF